MYASCSIIVLKMALLSLSLFVLVQSTRVSSYGLLKNLKACRKYDINQLGGFSAPSFYIDGKLVDKYVFCEILKENLERHCIVNKDVENQYCSLDAKLEKLTFRKGRLSLETVTEKESEGNDYDKKVQNGEDKNALKFRMQPKMLAVAVPAFFLVCCAVLCPCFQARKRDVNHSVLPKEQYSTDSVSSLEMNPVNEKFPGSPMRMGSPMRVPASPLRVPTSPSRFSMSPKLSRLGSVHLNMSQVARATHNFSPALVIGEGGFGSVYKAELPNGQFVAIKRARKEQFDSLRTEFKSEVELLAKIDHRNLVKLLGYVEKGNERLLITEYVPNGTLREYLDGLRGKILDFSQRIEISIDVAHGLTYLHLYAEKQIIHRDVKSSNILLTESMRAKVADFGFARFGDDNEKTHVSTKVKGTMGYLDPEYMRTYQLTSKSDVYSFGILLLEILTGRRPVDLKKTPDERVTIRWAFRKFNERKFLEMLDPMIRERVDEEILAKLFNLAIQCAAPTRVDRPDMKAVGEQLWEIRRDFLRNQGRN